MRFLILFLLSLSAFSLKAQWEIVNISNNHYRDMEMNHSHAFFVGGNGGALFAKLNLSNDSISEIVNSSINNCIEVEVINDSLVYAIAVLNTTFMKINPLIDSITYTSLPFSLGAGDLLFINDSTGFLSYQNNGSAMYRTFDSGVTWTEIFDTSLVISSSGALGGRDLLYDNDTLFGIIGGAYIYSPNLGDTWYFKDIPNSNGTYFAMNKMDAKIICVGQGFSSSLGINYGAIAVSHDYGNTWDFYQNNYITKFNDVFMVNDSVVYAVGRAQGQLYNIYKSIDGGISWHPQWYATTPALNYELRKVRCINEDTCYVCGDPGVIIKTTNGGGPLLGLSVAENISENTITVFPNPSDNIVNISSTASLQRLQLFDTKGALIYDKNNMNTNIASLDICQLSSGMYLIHITTQEGVYTQKIQKR